MGMIQLGATAIFLKKAFHQHTQVILISESNQGLTLVIRDAKVLLDVFYILKKSMLFNFHCLLWYLGFGLS